MKATCVECGQEFDRRRSAITCGPECSKARERRVKSETRRKRYAENIEAERAKVREKSKRHYWKNAEKQRERKRLARQADPDKARAYLRQWYAEHAETVRERVRQYKLENWDKVQAGRRTYYALNMDKFREWSARYRANNLERVRRLSRESKRVTRAASRLGVPRILYLAMRFTSHTFTGEVASA